MTEQHVYMIYDRESYAADGERAPESVMSRAGPRFRVVYTVVGRHPYPIGWTQESADIATIDAARAAIPPGCICTLRGPHYSMVPIESWKAPEGVDPGPLRIAELEASDG